MSSSEPPADDDDPPLGRRSLSRQFLMALTLALLPIGLLAAYLSVSGFREAREAGINRVSERGVELARAVNEAFQDHGLVLRALAVQRAGGEGVRSVCAGELSRFVELDQLFSALYRLDDNGNVVCKSQQGGMLSQATIDRVQNIDSGPSGFGSALFFTRERQAMIFAVHAEADDPYSDSIVALVPISRLRAELAGVARPAGSSLTIQVSEATAETIAATAPVRQDDGSYGLIAQTGLGGLAVNYAEPLEPLSWRTVAAILAPTVMWLAALLIAWATLRREVLRPLRRMRAGLEQRAGGHDLVKLADSAGPTREFMEFATAYDRLAADQKAGREQREAALAAQSRLIREVHHRVKNNLQIITSLISVKSRATDDPGQQRAYGTIQMRVTALAHVHRWLYADDITRGVDLAALINDLANGLEGSIESTEDVETKIRTSLEGIFVGQDAAVPVSFLITELIAATATRLGSGHRLDVDIALKGVRNESVCLTLTSDAFQGEDMFAVGNPSASARILQGMVRQLRANFVHDAAKGSYFIEFPAGRV